MELNLDKLKKRLLKVCPVITRLRHGNLEILLFQHPLAGIQLAKGTIEQGETLEEAALRELYEESGLHGNTPIFLEHWDSDSESQEWYFVKCECSVKKDRWVHFTDDGGGLEFQFFWHPLGKPIDAPHYPVYKNALLFIEGLFLLK